MRFALDPCSRPGTAVTSRLVLFPTCQVRVLRFYQSCSSPPRLALLLLLFLLRLLLPPPPVSPRPCLHQLPPSLPPCQLFAKLFANFRAQWAPLDLNLGPAQLSVHRWTSTWDLPSSVHRWTSTWDLPSSVCTAGRQPGTCPAQPGTCPAQCAPRDLNGQIECQKICQIECQIECQKICQIKCHEICQIECQKVCQRERQKICQIECQKICQIEC